MFWSLPPLPYHTCHKKQGKCSRVHCRSPDASQCIIHTRFSINVCWMNERRHRNLYINWPLAVCYSLQIIHSAHPLIILFPTGSFISRVTGDEDRDQWVIFWAAGGKFAKEGAGGREWAENKVNHWAAVHWLLLIDIPHSCTAPFISMGRWRLDVILNSTLRHFYSGPETA